MMLKMVERGVEGEIEGEREKMRGWLVRTE
jgi:hypothetical protein